jgi:superfamily II DNA or RNA helicase
VLTKQGPDACDVWALEALQNQQPQDRADTSKSQAPALRDYQHEAVDRVRAADGMGRKRVLFVLPTGGGKTIVFANIIASAAKRGRRTLIIAHRVEILDQIHRMKDLASQRAAEARTHG